MPAQTRLYLYRIGSALDTRTEPASLLIASCYSSSGARFGRKFFCRQNLEAPPSTSDFRRLPDHKHKQGQLECRQAPV